MWGSKGKGDTENDEQSGQSDATKLEIKDNKA